MTDIKADRIRRLQRETPTTCAENKVLPVSNMKPSCSALSAVAALWYAQSGWCTPNISASVHYHDGTGEHKSSGRLTFCMLWLVWHQGVLNQSVWTGLSAERLQCKLGLCAFKAGKTTGILSKAIRSARSTVGKVYNVQYSWTVCESCATMSEAVVCGVETAFKLRTISLFLHLQKELDSEMSNLCNFKVRQLPTFSK